MPRGYLKRHSSAVGIKQARGGHGRNFVYHKTYRWLKHPRCPRTMWDNSYDITAATTYSETDDYDDDDDDYEHWEEQCAAIEIEPGPEEELRQAQAVAPMEPIPANTKQLVTKWSSTDLVDEIEDSDTDVFDADEKVADISFVHIQETSPNAVLVMRSSEESYSFAGTSLNECGDDSLPSDTFSFCAISTRLEDSHEDPAKERNNHSVSTASTKWEFVMTEGLVSESSVHISPSYVVDDATTIASQDYCSVVAAVPNNIAQTQNELATCAICLEHKSSIKRLMSRCQHPAACLQCLKSHYLDHQIKNVSNFPLKCFWPWCSRIVRDTQVRQIVSSESQMGAYYSQVSRARALRREERLSAEVAKLMVRRIQNLRWQETCCGCGETQIVYPGRCQTNQYSCQKCQQLQPTTLSIEEVQSIVTATGEYLVNCPSCVTLINKDGGCDDMCCTLCNTEFSFKTCRFAM